MKPFDTLSVDELDALDQDQIQTYIDRACAEAGVRLLPSQAPEPPPERTITKSAKHYVVGAMRFSDEAAARRVADAINAEAEYSRTLETVGNRWDYGTPRYDTKDADPTVNVSQEYVFTMTEAAAQKDDIDKWSQAKKDYEAAKKEYDDLITKRSAIASGIYDAIHTAARTVRRRRFMLEQLEHYVRLAGGDTAVAARFLWQAYPASDCELIGVAKPDYATPYVAQAEPADDIEL